MLDSLKLKHVGPAPSIEAEFAERLNLLTGDNGLGKSFLLDVLWWSLTRKWPAEINKKLIAGKQAKPSKTKEARIQFSFTRASEKKKKEVYESSFSLEDQAWTGRPGRPSNPGLVLYAMADGSFAVWDPSRNYWKTRQGMDIQDRPPAYVFSPPEVWDGLYPDQDKSRPPWCNGLISDWGGWQKEDGQVYKRLCSILETLSPSEEEKIRPGTLTKVSLDDDRDIPTLLMPYGAEVPVLHASSGMRRIIALAYLLLWSWEGHKKASHLLEKEPTKQIIFLVDEIEAHLHPKWQRCILRSLLGVMKGLTKEAEVQLIAATHSPLIFVSLDALFEETKDAWFDFDFEKEPSPRVVLSKRPFQRVGDVSKCLVSQAFDLKSPRSEEAERVVQEACAFFEPSGEASPPDLRDAMEQKLNQVLGERDEFWLRWKWMRQMKGEA